MFTKLIVVATTLLAFILANSVDVKCMCLTDPPRICPCPWESHEEWKPYEGEDLDLQYDSPQDDDDDDDWDDDDDDDSDYDGRQTNLDSREEIVDDEECRVTGPDGECYKPLSSRGGTGVDSIPDYSVPRGFLRVSSIEDDIELPKIKYERVDLESVPIDHGPFGILNKKITRLEKALQPILDERFEGFVGGLWRDKFPYGSCCGSTPIELMSSAIPLHLKCNGRSFWDNCGPEPRDVEYRISKLTEHFTDLRDSIELKKLELTL